LRISEPASLGREVATVPGVKELRAANEIEARRLCRETSWRALLSGPDRRLLFNGGIRAAASHEGDNTRENAIDLVNRSRSKTKPIARRGFGWTLRTHIFTEADRR
jgi:hypothetical protein